MTKFIASVTIKNEKTLKKELEIIEREYSSKSRFYNDLRSNGYSVRFISTSDKFDVDCEKWHEKNEQRKRLAKHITQVNKECAEKLGMTVKEYKEWMNGKCL